MMITTKVYYNLSELTNDSRYIINLPADTKLGVENLVSTLVQDSLPTADTISQELMSHIWANLAFKEVLCLEVKHPVWQNVNKDNINDFITAEEKDHEIALLGQSI